ncbi:hypothetical protein M885DRAFT_623076 [Pelagophyceae sp. CCMP2097]|nr:hypothetical protein M885DRAFT_623076 [Pelagophyceae sp. CCMP2097]
MGRRAALLLLLGRLAFAAPPRPATRRALRNESDSFFSVSTWAEVRAAAAAGAVLISVDACDVVADSVLIVSEVALEIFSNCRGGNGTAVITATHGGRVFFVDGGLLYLRGVGVANALADGDGAAILNVGGEVTLDGGEFFSNSASGCGGVVSNQRGGKLEIASGSFYHNVARQGGVVCNGGGAGADPTQVDASQTLIRGGAFLKNAAAGAGGAVANRGVLGVLGGNFDGNAAGIGGALWNDGFASASVYGGTFSYNVCALAGHAVCSAPMSRFNVYGGDWSNAGVGISEAFADDTAANTTQRWRLPGDVGDYLSRAALVAALVATAAAINYSWLQYSVVDDNSARPRGADGTFRFFAGAYATRAPAAAANDGRCFLTTMSRVDPTGSVEYDDDGYFVNGMAYKIIDADAAARAAPETAPAAASGQFQRSCALSNLETHCVRLPAARCYTMTTWVPGHDEEAGYARKGPAARRRHALEGPGAVGGGEPDGGVAPVGAAGHYDFWFFGADFKGTAGVPTDFFVQESGAVVRQACAVEPPRDLSQARAAAAIVRKDVGDEMSAADEAGVAVTAGIALFAAWLVYKFAARELLAREHARRARRKTECGDAEASIGVECTAVDAAAARARARRGKAAYSHGAKVKTGGSAKLEAAAAVPPPWGGLPCQCGGLLRSAVHAADGGSGERALGGAAVDVVADAPAAGATEALGGDHALAAVWQISPPALPSCSFPPPHFGLGSPLERTDMFVCAFDASLRMALWSRGAARATGCARPLHLDDVAFRSVDRDKHMLSKAVRNIFRGEEPRPFVVSLLSTSGFLALLFHAVRCADDDVGDRGDVGAARLPGAAKEIVLLFGTPVDPDLASLAHPLETDDAAEDGGGADRSLQGSQKSQARAPAARRRMRASFSDDASIAPARRGGGRLRTSRSSDAASHADGSDAAPRRGRRQQSQLLTLLGFAAGDVESLCSRDFEQGLRDFGAPSENTDLEAPPSFGGPDVEEALGFDFSLEEAGLAAAAGVVYDGGEDDEPRDWCVQLLRLAAARGGRLDGPALHPFCATWPECTPAHGVLRAGVAAAAGVYAFAHVYGEVHVRARRYVGLAFGARSNDEAWPALADLYWRGDSWQSLDDRAADLGVVGGHLEVDDEARCVRWCVRPCGATDPPLLLALSRQVPLPMDKLWIAIEAPGHRRRDDDGDGADDDGGTDAAPSSWLPSPEECCALHAEGRFHRVSAGTCVMKATTTSAAAYRRAELRLGAVLGGASNAVDPRSRREMLSRHRSTLLTYLRGRSERRASRALGLVDERYDRLRRRISLLLRGAADARSSLYLLDGDVLALVITYLVFSKDDMIVAQARAATS